MKTDPFEGYLPAVAMRADAGILLPFLNDTEQAVKILEDLLIQSGQQKPSDQLLSLRKKISDLKATPRRAYQAISQCQAVNCWHRNDGESEAMWRLYAEGGRGVAIETTSEALKQLLKPSSRSTWSISIP